MDKYAENNKNQYIQQVRENVCIFKLKLPKLPHKQTELNIFITEIEFIIDNITWNKSPEVEEFIIEF